MAAEYTVALHPSPNLESSFTTSMEMLSEASMLPRVGDPFVLIGCTGGRVRPMPLFAVSPPHAIGLRLFANCILGCTTSHTFYLVQFFASDFALFLVYT